MLQNGVVSRRHHAIFVCKPRPWLHITANANEKPRCRPSLGLAQFRVGYVWDSVG